MLPYTYMYLYHTAEFSKLKDELPDSYKKSLEQASEKEEQQKAISTPDKESTPSEKTVLPKETTPTEEKEKVHEILT